MNSFDLSKREYDFIIENCNFINDELEIFNLKRQGFYNYEIALKLNISESTVKRRCKNIKGKISKEFL